jgi:hypothetical protein
MRFKNLFSLAICLDLAFAGSIHAASLRHAPVLIQIVQPRYLA